MGNVVVMINPRGSTGYGQAIVDGVNGDWGGKPFYRPDGGVGLRGAALCLHRQKPRVRAGGELRRYMANWVLGHTDRFKCIVSHDGMFNAESAFGSTEEGLVQHLGVQGASLGLLRQA